MGKTVSDPDAGAPDAYEFAIGDELRGERATLGKSLLDVQRDLRIKAAFIAAIEDADIAAFPNKGVIPGYVRSYARYLHLDPEEVYRRFCQNSGFSAGAQGFGNSKAAPGLKSAAKPKSGLSAKAAPTSGTFRPDFPLAQVRGIGLPQIPLSAIGSLFVLVALVGGLGYGGWTVLQNIQRVQFAPVDELPLAVSDVATITAPDSPTLAEPALTALASPVAATALADLYRHQEEEVPILVPRDGPIAAIDPDKIDLLAGRGRTAPPGAEIAKVVATADADALAVAAVVAASVTGSEPTADAAPVAATGEWEKLTVVAERAAWIRVYLDNGTIIFERILEKGETYSPPDGVGAPLIWAGNSGSVYVKVGDALHGPLGSGTRAARDVVLEPRSIVEHFALVDQIPEVISQTIGADAPRPEDSIEIR